MMIRISIGSTWFSGILSVYYFICQAWYIASHIN